MGGIMAAAAMGGSSDGGGSGWGGGGLSVTTDPGMASGSGLSSAVANVPAIKAIAAGGDGTYAYAWTVLEEPEDHPLTITSPGAAQTGFSFATPEAGQRLSGRVRITVTSAGQLVFTDVLVEYQDRRKVVG